MIKTKRVHSPNRLNQRSKGSYKKLHPKPPFAFHAPISIWIWSEKYIMKNILFFYQTISQWLVLLILLLTNSFHYFFDDLRLQDHSSISPYHNNGLSLSRISLRINRPFNARLNCSLHFFSKWYQSRIIPIFLYQLKHLRIVSFNILWPSVKNWIRHEVSGKGFLLVLDAEYD